MVFKHKHRLNSDILGAPVMRNFKYRGNFNRMWRKGSVTMSHIIDMLYKHYKHLIEKQKHDTPKKILSATFDKFFEEKLP